MLALCAFACRPAVALADYEGRLNLAVGSAYESNVFFAPSDEQGSASATSRLDGTVAWNSDASTLALSLDGLYQPYLDSQLGATSAIDAATTFTHEFEYSRSKLLVAYANASSLVDAFQTDGEFVGDQRRETITGGATEEIDLSETTSLAADVDASTVSFHDTPNGVVNYDYDYATGTLTWRKELSERLTIGVGAAGSWYDTGDNGFRNEVTTIGPAVSARYAINDRLSTAVDVSYRRDETNTRYFRGFAIDDTGYDYFGAVTIRRELDNGEVAIALRRTEQPSSTGTQDIRDEAQVSFRRSLAEKLDMRAITTLIDENSGGNDSDRKAVASELHFDWTVGEKLVASFSYRYVWQRSDSQPSNEQAHAVALTLTRSFEHGR